MTPLPYLSVIICIYNEEKNILDCLESVMAQTLENIEIIVVNDGSTDHSPALVTQLAHKDSRIRLTNQENKGLLLSRKRGLEESQASYFCFVDADDTIHPRHCELLYDTAVREDADIVFANISYVIKGKRAYSSFSREQERIIQSEINSWVQRDKEHRRFLPPHIGYSLCSSLFSRTLVREKKYMFPYRINLGEDVVIKSILFFSAKKIVYLPGNLYFFERTKQKKRFYKYPHFPLPDLFLIIENLISFYASKNVKSIVLYDLYHRGKLFCTITSVILKLQAPYWPAHPLHIVVRALWSLRYLIIKKKEN